MEVDRALAVFLRCGGTGTMDDITQCYIEITIYYLMVYGASAIMGLRSQVVSVMSIAHAEGPFDFKLERKPGGPHRPGTGWRDRPVRAPDGAAATGQDRRQGLR